MATSNHQTEVKMPDECETKLSCDICVQRQSMKPPVATCSHCEIRFCDDCLFVHSKIPSTRLHKVVRIIRGALHEGSSVDVDTSITVDGSEQAAETSKDNCPTFFLKHKFTSEAGDDEVKPAIRAVLMLDSDIILATDWGNCTLKAFDKEGNLLGDQFFGKSGEDAGRMQGITQINATKVMVTLPSYKKIASIEIKRNGEKVEFSPMLHPTRRRYFGIAHLPQVKQVIVGTTDTVDVLTYSCKYLTTVDYSGFANPYNMATAADDMIWVSDSKNNCLFKINAKLEVAKIEIGKVGLQLRGVAADRDGNIFFGARKSDGIGWMKNGELMGYIQTGEVKESVGISFQQTSTGKWVVVSQDDGMIKVFTVK